MIKDIYSISITDINLKDFRDQSFAPSVKSVYKYLSLSPRTLFHKLLQCSLYIKLSEYEWMGFITFSVYWSKYICLCLFLLYQLSMVSDKLWFSCSSSVSVWAAYSTSISYSAATVQFLSEQLTQPQYLIQLFQFGVCLSSLLNLNILFSCSSSVSI